MSMLDRMAWTGAIVACAITVTACSRDGSPRTMSAGEIDRTPIRRALPPLDAGKIEEARAAAARKIEEHDGAEAPATFDQPAERERFFLEQRLGTADAPYPLEHLRRELERIRERQRAAAASASGTPPGGIVAWDELGPGNIGGRTRALAIDPDDPDTMLAGGVAGGIWKTTDGGATWNVVDDMLPNLAISTIVIDPTNPDVMYAGTGEGYLAGQMAAGLGIYKSIDGGDSWFLLGSTQISAFTYVNKLQISPNDPNRVYAGTRYGVYRSLDGGLTWNVILANPTYTSGPEQTNGCAVGCTDVQLRADANPDVVWAAFGSTQRDGVYRSDDGGDTWLAYTTGINQGRMSIALAPSDNDIVYILMADNGTGGAWGQLVNVFRSVDGGATFEARVNLDAGFGPYLLSNVILATGCLEGGTYSQGWYDNIIAVDPLDSNRVWVGGVDMFRSDDGGANFELAAYWIFYTFFPPPPYQLHPDHHNIVFHPGYDGVTNQTMFVTNDGGIFRTQNARAATTIEDCPFPGEEPFPEIVWERMNNGYGVTQFYHGDSARTADRFAGGAQDNGTSMVSAVGTPDDWDLIFGGDGGYVAIDHTDADTIYLEYQGFPNIWKSIDGGESFDLSVDGITDTDGLFITPFAMDPSDANVLWTGGSRPWRTVDGAASWQAAGPNLAGPATISALAAAPSDPNRVYLGFSNGWIAHTSNALAPLPTWTPVLPAGAGWVSSIAVDEHDPDVAYSTSSWFGVPHVRRTTNGGSNWLPIDGDGAGALPDIPAHWVVPRPCDPDQLYVGTELGVFVTDDGGASWQPDPAFPSTIVEALDWHTNHELVAFTHGRGAFLAQLRTCASCLGDLNGDGETGFEDLLQLLIEWGPCTACIADFDLTGDVDFADLITLLSTWGTCP